MQFNIYCCIINLGSPKGGCFHIKWIDLWIHNTLICIICIIICVCFVKLLCEKLNWGGFP